MVTDKIDYKVPEGLISGTFNEGIPTKRFLVMFQGWRNNRNKSTSFSCLDMGTRPLFVFFHFSNFELQHFQNYSSKRTIKEMCQVSMKYIEPDGRDNDLKIPVFLVFFRMSLEIQSAFLARHHG